MSSSQHQQKLMANRQFYTDCDTESDDSNFDHYFPRMQIPEYSFRGPYSRHELENARSSLVNNVLSATGTKWDELKYKLGMCHHYEGADTREKTRQCMFDMHSSVWCRGPLNEKRVTVNIPPIGSNFDESTSTSNDKPADEGSESSRVISHEKPNSDIAISNSDEDTNESNACAPKDSAMSNRQQKRQEEIVIDLDSEPEYPNLAFLYEN